MQIRLNTTSDVPAYRQIADQLRAFAVEGLLRPGELLPPVRRLALDLGIHFNTVAESYRLLAQEGLIEITRGHRARIIDRSLPRRTGPEVADGFRQRIRELVAVVRTRGLSTRQIAGELRAMAEALEKI